jgi:hypothetical protein
VADANGIKIWRPSNVTLISAAATLKTKTLLRLKGRFDEDYPLSVDQNQHRWLSRGSFTLHWHPVELGWFQMNIQSQT